MPETTLPIHDIQTVKGEGTALTITLQNADFTNGNDYAMPSRSRRMFAFIVDNSGVAHNLVATAEQRCNYSVNHPLAGNADVTIAMGANQTKVAGSFPRERLADANDRGHFLWQLNTGQTNIQIALCRMIDGPND